MSLAGAAGSNPSPASRSPIASTSPNCSFAGDSHRRSRISVAPQQPRGQADSVHSPWSQGSFLDFGVSRQFIQTYLQRLVDELLHILGLEPEHGVRTGPL